MGKHISKDDIVNKLLIKTIDKNLNNNKLIMCINKYFTQKGFSVEIVEGLFNGEISVNLLTDYYKMALCRAMEEYFCSDVKGGVNLEQTKINASKGEFKLENYWVETLIHAFDGVTAKKVVVNQILLNGFTRKDRAEWCGYMTYEQIYNYLILSRFYYNYDSQREPTVVSLGKNKVVVVPTINKESVDSISEAIISGDFEDTQIVLNCRIGDNNVYKLSSYEVFKNDDVQIDNLEIFQKLDVVDGMHRILGISKAVESSNGNEDILNRKICVRLVVRTVKKCENIITQSFKRGDTGKSYLDSMEVNDYTKFVDDLILETKGLTGKVSKTYGLAVAQESLTYKNLMVDMIKEWEVEVSDLAVYSSTLGKLSKRLTEILYAMDKYTATHKDDKIKNIKLLRNANIFSVYMQTSYNLQDKTIVDFELYNDLFDMITSLDNITIKELKLNSDKCNINKVVSYFVK